MCLDISNIFAVKNISFLNLAEFWWLQTHITKEENLWSFKIGKQDEDQDLGILFKLIVSMVFIFELPLLIFIYLRMLKNKFKLNHKWFFKLNIKIHMKQAFKIIKETILSSLFKPVVPSNWFKKFVAVCSLKTV
jgi:hypothetical protein